MSQGTWAGLEALAEPERGWRAVAARVAPLGEAFR